MEGRMTFIEAGARMGIVAVDQKTIAYLKGRPYAPSGPQWDHALALTSDVEAKFDRVVCGLYRCFWHTASGDLGYLARDSQ